MNNYVPAEKLLAEIDSMLSACTKQTHTGVFNTCTHIKGLITSLQQEQPSLPSNIDEAAEEIMPISYGSLELDCYGGSEPVYSREQMVEMFKAGVEWIARQGQTIESIVWRDEDGNLYIEEYIDKNKFKHGYGVIIQVREK